MSNTNNSSLSNRAARFIIATGKKHAPAVGGSLAAIALVTTGYNHFFGKDAADLLRENQAQQERTTDDSNKKVLDILNNPKNAPWVKIYNSAKSDRVIKAVERNAICKEAKGDDSMLNDVDTIINEIRDGHVPKMKLGANNMSSCDRI